MPDHPVSAHATTEPETITPRAAPPSSEDRSRLALGVAQEIHDLLESAEHCGPAELLAIHQMAWHARHFILVLEPVGRFDENLRVQAHGGVPGQESRGMLRVVAPMTEDDESCGPWGARRNPRKRRRAGTFNQGPRFASFIPFDPVHQEGGHPLARSAVPRLPPSAETSPLAQVLADQVLEMCALGLDEKALHQIVRLTGMGVEMLLSRAGLADLVSDSDPSQRFPNTSIYAANPGLPYPGGALAPASTSETFGAKTIREILSGFREMIHGDQTESRVRALATARAEGLHDVAAALEAEIVGQPLTPNTAPSDSEVAEEQEAAE